MSHAPHQAAAEPIAIVGLAAIMPDAPTAEVFWRNLRAGHNAITDVPADRWDPALYHDEDRSAPDKTYSRIGGWVRDYEWDPRAWRLPFPPNVVKHVDVGQRWAVSAARAALVDAGWPDWGVDTDRVACIIGNALGGEKMDATTLRIRFPEFAEDLAAAPSFAELPAEVQAAILDQAHERFVADLPEITEDTMPGELANVLAGRVAALLNLRGPNFTTDAACASAMAAMYAAIQGLRAGDFDAAVTGGLDRNMGPGGFVRFCKIGALSATGSRPFDAEADGFVMGEGVSLFVLKRLRDAEAAGDRIYAVIAGIGGSSDGRGKGITAPNPVGQKLAIQRAWADAGLDPATVGMIEAHGTSTRVGDATELGALSEVFAGLPVGSVALGSVKSNIGHLKAAAGAAGLFKTAKCLHEQVLVPSINVRTLNPKVDWSAVPLAVNTELRPWPARPDGLPRRAGISSFGFGGTNFHMVVEEYVPGRNGAGWTAAPAASAAPAPHAVAPLVAGVGGVTEGHGPVETTSTSAAGPARKAPLRGALVLGAADAAGLLTQLQPIAAAAAAGVAPAVAAPDAALGAAAVRLAIDFADAADLAKKADKAIGALQREVSGADAAGTWRLLRAQGVFLGRGPAAPLAFLFTGQGSQYMNMLRDLCDSDPTVAGVFAEADRIMTPILGKPLTEYVFADIPDRETGAQLEAQLLRTELTQPAVLTADRALAALLADYGIEPDMVMGHSLGEYGALVAAGSMTFDAALEAVSARGRGMARVEAEDRGAMAAVFGPLERIEEVIAHVDGYAVVANVNSNTQAVIGGATPAVEAAMAACTEAGMRAVRIPVSHAFHTDIVAPAAVPLMEQLHRLRVAPPTLPLVANVTGEFYPADIDADGMVEVLGKQVASPVQFVRGLHTLYAAGARVFVETGPKKALHGFAEEVLGSQHDDVVALFTNHPKQGDVAAFNQALCGLYAAGHGFGGGAEQEQAVPEPVGRSAAVAVTGGVDRDGVAAAVLSIVSDMTGYPPELLDLDLDLEADLGVDTVKQAEVVAAVRERFGVERDDSMQLRDFPTLNHVIEWVLGKVGVAPVAPAAPTVVAAPVAAAKVRPVAVPAPAPAPVAVAPVAPVPAVAVVPARPVPTTRAAAPAVTPARQVGTTAPVTITGAALGLPGSAQVFNDANLAAILAGANFIGSVPQELREAMVDRSITRLVKSGAAGPEFSRIDSTDEVLRLAGRSAPFDLVAEYGVDPGLDRALDRATRLAIAAGFDALRDAGIPLVMRYKDTTIGTRLPDRWALPESMRDDTGVIFASAFPGLDAMADDLEAYGRDRARREQILALGGLRERLAAADAPVAALAEVDGLLARLRAEQDANPFAFDRRFVFKVLSMGHSQFAELIGARGPNTAINAACASATQALSVAEDWIRTGRARRVVVVSADDVSSDRLLPWVGAGFLASGAAATDAVVSEAATPFDRRRHGMIVGMGAAAFVVEAPGVSLERGVQPICEVLGTITANSAFHGTRLDVDHVRSVMERLVSGVEVGGVRRGDIAGRCVFMSHETYTPARGGSAAAEINALRSVFGAAADAILIANTKGMTGHAMGAGIEDVVAIKALETGLVPPVANHREVDPDLGPLNLSRGGAHDVHYALRLAAGFGSQISMALLRWTPMPDGRRREVFRLGYASRLVDAAAWQRWLDAQAGRPGATTEVVQRRLRVADAAGGVATGAAVTQGSAPAPVGVSPSVVAPVPLSGSGAPVPLPAAVRRTVTPAPAAPATWAPAAPATSAPAAPAAAAAPGVAPAAGPSDEVITDTVLEIVTGLTGYPRDLLDLDLDMEADLGVDTVKQAEVFAAVRDRFGIDRDDQLQLRDFPTLAHVIGWVRGKIGGGVPEAVAAPAAVPAAAAVPPLAVVPPAVPVPSSGHVPGPVRIAPVPLVLGASTRSAAAPAAVPVALAPAPAPVATPAPAATSGDAAGEGLRAEVTGVVLAVVTDLTGYPEELLDLDLDMEADLGVDTVKQAEVFAAVRERFAIDRDDQLQLRDFPTLRHVIGWVLSRLDGGASGDPATEAGPAPAGPATGTAVPLPPAAPVDDAVSPTAAAPAVAASDDEVVATVLAVVTDLTGYPEDLLDLDADMEADLGVDTVKQAEVFATVRERFGIARDEQLQLRDFPTLTHVIGWVRANIAPVAAAAVETAAAPVVEPAEVQASAPAVPDAAGIVRRVPVALLRPALEDCTATGIALESGARVVVALDRAGVGTALVEQLRDRGVEVATIDPEVTGAAAAEQLGQSPVTGLYWLRALDPEPAVDDCGEWDPVVAATELARTTNTLHTVVRHLHPAGLSFLIVATAMGGRHGYDEVGAVHPFGGAVRGYAKAYHREVTTALVKAVDIVAERSASEIAGLLVAETLADPGCVEVGHADDARWGVGMVERALDPAATAADVAVRDTEPVVVVSGATGAIVAAITADIASRHHGGTFHLLARTPLPEAADEDLRLLATDPAALQARIADRLRGEGARPTPVTIRQRIGALERAAAVLATMETIRATGGTAVYHVADVTDRSAVAAVMDRIAAEHDRIDLLLHGAGLEISKDLARKDDAEFASVLAIKADGWFNLLHTAATAARPLDLGAVVVFGSVAGRFGNVGQVDYAAGNDVLTRLVSALRRRRPGVRAVTLDWTAWAGLGMATRGSIPQLMAAAGVQMLPPEIGVPWVAGELRAGAPDAEVVVAGALGAMAASAAASPVAVHPATDGPMLGAVAAVDEQSGWTFTVDLDPAAQPFLDDHRIDGTAVLPGVMGIEAFLEAAAAVAPGWRATEVVDVDFAAPLKFYRDQPRTVTVTAAPVYEGAGVLRVACAVRAERRLVGAAEPVATTHFVGAVRMVRADDALSGAVSEGAMSTLDIAAGDDTAPTLGATEVYRMYFHGPAYQVVERAWRAPAGVVAAMVDNLPANHEPAHAPTVSSPRVTELCLQVAGLVEAGLGGRLALPSHIDRLVLGRGATGPGVRAVASPTGIGFDVVAVDGDGREVVALHGYRTSVLPVGLPEDVLAPIRAAVALPVTDAPESGDDTGTDAETDLDPALPEVSA